jgi:TetR/AcrR family transcriptional regulator, transcriptional repressor for nem operon
MARPKEFDPDVVLVGAIDAFRRHGYDGISTAELADAMQIGRQSMYDTFGDKAALYRRALERYRDDNAAVVDSCLAEDGALDAIQAVFDLLAGLDRHDLRCGCLLVNAIGELADTDTAVSDLLVDNQRRISALFADTVRRGQAQRQIAASIDPEVAGAQLLVTFYGIRVMAKVDPTSVSVRDAAAQATAFLRR